MTSTVDQDLRYPCNSHSGSWFSLWCSQIPYLYFNKFSLILRIMLRYCITVLYWWGDHCWPMDCDVFKIYCAPPNLDITRTWVCRLNFAQRRIFSGFRFFNEPGISDSGPTASSLSRRTCSQNFYVMKKSIDLRWIWARESWISRRARHPETTEIDRVKKLITLKSKNTEYYL